MSQTNQLYVKFVSDATRALAGFLINWDSTTEGNILFLKKNKNLAVI